MASPAWTLSALAEAHQFLLSVDHPSEEVTTLHSGSLVKLCLLLAAAYPLHVHGLGCRLESPSISSNHPNPSLLNKMAQYFHLTNNVLLLTLNHP
jgi:hypothetical protein